MDTLSKARGTIRAALLISASLGVHVWLVFLSRVFEDARAFGDLSLYNYWAFQLNQGSPIYGVATEWIYPALAIAPIWLPSLFTGKSYELAWLAMVFLINTAVVLAIDSGRRGVKPTGASWFFMLSIALLGPVAISRIDSISVAMAIFGILRIASARFGVAAFLFTIAGWIKIWPVALFLSMIASFRTRTGPLVIAAGTSVTILLVGFGFGGSAVLSFVGSQQDRGLQIESVLATPWMWLAKSGFSKIYFDDDVLTNQVSGPLVTDLASWSNWFMLLALIITLGLAARAVHNGQKPNHVFVWASLAAVAELIAFNKVGSPQFMLWLAVPLLAGIYLGVSKFKVALASVLVILLLTQLIYPIFYLDLLALEEVPLWILTLRNLLLLGLVVVGNLRLAGKQAL